MFEFGPNILFADEDDEQEESPQHVEAVNDSKENLNRFIDLAMLIIMLVNDVMNTFNSPQNAKNKKKLEVKNLKKNMY